MGNYNLKNIMLGIGIGLVFSSMINISMGSKELSVEEIRKEAAKHNLIVLTNDDIINNQTQKAEAAEAPKVTPTPTAVPKPTQVPVSPTPTKVATQAVVKVNVKEGMSSESITDLLVQSGLVKDKKAFVKRLGELGKNNKLKIGSFDIPQGSSYDNIIKILSN